jgi:xanthine dehydrogenase YagR molybdenum-binding subunit
MKNTAAPKSDKLGMVGIPAAIANAVLHATGKRFRDLPITPDKLLSVT